MDAEMIETNSTPKVDREKKNKEDFDFLDRELKKYIKSNDLIKFRRNNEFFEFMKDAAKDVYLTHIWEDKLFDNGIEYFNAKKDKYIEYLIERGIEYFYENNFIKFSKNNEFIKFFKENKQIIYLSLEEKDFIFAQIKDNIN